MSLDHLDDGDESGGNVSSNSSRLGFRASTEVQPGLTAFMQAETNIRYDEGGGSTWASRDSFVGLRGDDWGRVRIGDIRNLTRTATGGPDEANIGNVFDERFKNGVP